MKTHPSVFTVHLKVGSIKWATDSLLLITTVLPSIIIIINRISVIALSGVDHGFESWLVQTKYYTIGIYCFYISYAALRGKSKDLLARNYDNVSEWSDVSVCGLLFQ